jgi:hypothetical protein
MAAPWRRDLLGGVVFRDASRQESLSIDHVRRQTGLATPPRGKPNRCCRALVVAFIASVAKEGCCMFVVVGLWLLAADRSSWDFLATLSAVCDDVEGCRLRHRHQGMTWLAADHGGSLSLAGLSGATHRWKTAQATSSACCHGGRGYVSRVKQGGEVGLWWRLVVVGDRGT